MYLVIFRCVSSACIYLNVVCVIGCQKIVYLKLLTFILHQYKGKFAVAFQVIYGRRIGTSKIKGDCVQVSYELD